MGIEATGDNTCTDRITKTCKFTVLLVRVQTEMEHDAVSMAWSRHEVD